MPLILVADSAAGAGLFVVGTVLGLLGLSILVPPVPDLSARIDNNWPVLLVCVYLPALLIVLRPVLEPRLAALRHRVSS